MDEDIEMEDIDIEQDLQDTFEYLEWDWANNFEL